MPDAGIANPAQVLANVITVLRLVVAAKPALPSGGFDLLLAQRAEQGIRFPEAPMTQGQVLSAGFKGSEQVSGIECLLYTLFRAGAAMLLHPTMWPGSGPYGRHLRVEHHTLSLLLSPHAWLSATISICSGTPRQPACSAWPAVSLHCLTSLSPPCSYAQACRPSTIRTRVQGQARGDAAAAAIACPEAVSIRFTMPTPAGQEGGGVCMGVHAEGSAATADRAAGRVRHCSRNRRTRW